MEVKICKPVTLEQAMQEAIQAKKVSFNDHRVQRLTQRKSTLNYNNFRGRNFNNFCSNPRNNTYGTIFEITIFPIIRTAMTVEKKR